MASAKSGVGELRQAVIQNHFRQPRNRGALGGDALSGKAHNPFCGDTVRIWARVEDGVLAEVTFDGRGCSISQAAASMLTVVVAGQPTTAVGPLRQAFLDSTSPNGPALPPELGDLRALAGVGRFPSRIRCAVLPFDALEDALEDASTDAPRNALRAVPSRAAKRRNAANPPK